MVQASSLRDGSLHHNSAIALPVGDRRATQGDPDESIAETIARLPRTVELVLIVNDARLMIDKDIQLNLAALSHSTL